MPKYDWEPVVPQAQPTDPAGAAAPQDAECQNGGMPPAMQLVFKGLQWHTYTVAYQRENGAWELCGEIRRDQDDERVRERRKLPPPVENDPGIETPQAPDAASDTDLQDERNWP